MIKVPMAVAVSMLKVSDDVSACPDLASSNGAAALPLVRRRLSMTPDDDVAESAANAAHNITTQAKQAIPFNFLRSFFSARTANAAHRILLKTIASRGNHIKFQTFPTSTKLRESELDLDRREFVAVGLVEGVAVEPATEPG